MKPFASLTNRIFFATALLAVLSIAAAIYIVNRAVTRQAEDELHNGLDEASTLVMEYRALLFDHFANEATLVADLPKLKAAMDTNDPLTVRDIAEGYRQLMKADFFVLTRHGRVLARFGANGLTDEELMHLPGMMGTSSGQKVTGYWPAPHGVLQVLSVPIMIDRELLGTLVVGASLDSQYAARFKRLTSSDIAFAANGRVQAATLPEPLWPALDTLARRPGLTPQMSLDGNDYIALTERLSPDDAGGSPVVIILRSRSERLRFLRPLHTLLGFTALFAVLAATLLSYAIARTVTRPLGAITATMREMAATGDLTRRIPETSGRWRDEDAHLLATTFNAMTDSIQRFQREAAQRERLSSLGRLSTVVAHEIRNPLMIIKAAVRTLRREDVKPAQVQAATADIDEEVSRLNRIVTEVLDFARPIKFEFEQADVNALASDAARAASLDGGKPQPRLHLDDRIPAVTTDPGRLRQVLINVLSNAVQAVEARGAAAGDASIHLTTSRLDGSRLAITVRDRGVGIAPEDLARIFDPYFTTRRTGTGIGLAISRNIVEGLGGRITVHSQPERGTEVRIELPIHSTPEEHGHTRTSRA